MKLPHDELKEFQRILQEIYTNRERSELSANIPANVDDANIAAERLQQEITDAKLLLISVISELKQELPRIFSEVVAKPNFLIIVESIDPKSKSDDIMKQVKGGIDVVELGFGINHIKKAKNQNVVIGCESEGDRNTLQDRLKRTTDNLTVYRPVIKKPALASYGSCLRHDK
ncbi:unnamed protein product [Parnassius apollo]|uniref:(apollo) hypothetical protein n=1 Tax=Parnassius apollo TaxID=110799 RepID=A0A8S3WC58_PARAO|nr:unnamed protein product [Parnassius apollo]